MWSFLCFFSKCFQIKYHVREDISKLVHLLGSCIRANLNMPMYPKKVQLAIQVEDGQLSEQEGRDSPLAPHSDLP